MIIVKCLQETQNVSISAMKKALLHLATKNPSDDVIIVLMLKALLYQLQCIAACTRCELRSIMKWAPVVLMKLQDF
jgi:hypothetical protein